MRLLVTSETEEREDRTLGQLDGAMTDSAR